MYNNSVAKIKIDNLLSPNIDVERGTEQGPPLSPDLFKIFIRDLSSLLKSIGNFPYSIKLQSHTYCGLMTLFFFPLTHSTFNKT